MPDEPGQSDGPPDQGCENARGQDAFEMTGREASDTGPSAARRGLRLISAAARANVLPGLILWAFGLAVVLGYFYVPSVAGALQHVADLKNRLGLFYAIPALAVLGGFVPFALQTLQRDRERNFSPRYLAFLMVLWGYKGAEVSLLYDLQAWLFGDATDLPTIAAQVAFDQFIYIPLLGAPTLVLPYLWANGGFDWAGFRAKFRPGWYRRLLVPVMVPNWLVWIPGATLIYVLPLALQLPIQNVISCLWACMLLFITRHETEPMTELGST